jgi:hypothetical protein
MRLVALVLALLVTALPAVARPLGAEEEKALGRAADAYLNAIKSGNAEKIVAAIPPRIVNVFAGSAGIESKEITRTLVAQTRELVKGSKFRDLKADRVGVEVNDATLADGTQVTWAVLPTTFTAEVGGSKTLNSQPMLAISEGGKWYFVRVDGPQQKQIVAIAYPFLSQVAFPEATSTPSN